MVAQYYGKASSLPELREGIRVAYKAVLCCIILSIVSCNAKNKSEASGIEKIEVAKALESSQTVNASALGIESFEYIPLETNENTFRLAKPYMVLTMDDDKLIAKWRLQMAMFNRETGDYISDIGKYGDDPYSHGLVAKSVNDRSDKGLVSAFVRSYKEIVEYSVSSGQIVNRIDIKDVIVDNDTLLSPTSLTLYDVFIQDNENIFGFLPNVFGDSPFRLVKYDKSGNLKKVYPQGQALEVKSNTFTSYPGEAIFYEFNEAVMFKERYSDTLFMVNDESLIPRYLFDLKEKSPPYQDKNNHVFPNKESYLRANPPFPYVDRTGYIFIESIIEYASFFVFSITYKEEESYGFFDKTAGKTHISKLPNDPINGFYNDIDDFIPFRPTYLDRAKNELVGFVTAEDVLIWFEKIPELAGKLPKELSALSQIKPEDNPVVMIGKITIK